MKFVTGFITSCIPQRTLLSCKRRYNLNPLPSITLIAITRPQARGSYATRTLICPSNRVCFSSKSSLHQQQSRQDAELPNGKQAHKKKSARLPAGKTSLRRVAVEAQRSRDGHQARRESGLERQSRTKVGVPRKNLDIAF